MMIGHQFSPMTVGQILDRIFRLYRNNFVRFIAIVAIIYVPITLISLIFVSLIAGSFEESLVAAQETGVPAQARTEGDVASILAMGLVAVFLFLLAQVLCKAVLIKSVSDSYLGNETTVGQAYKAILPRLLTIIIAAILVIIVEFIGFMLLVVPGIIFALWFALTAQAIVVEKLGPIAGMKRSKALVSGNLGKVFGLGFLIIIISWIIGQVFQYAGGLVAVSVAAEDLMTATIIKQLFSMAGQALVMPISAGAFILLYYDLRIRKEGFDLEMLARSFGSEAMRPDAVPPLQQF